MGERTALINQLRAVLAESAADLAPKSLARRPAVIQRKVTNGYRSVWTAEMQAMARSVTGTAALARTPRFETILAAFR